MPVAPTKRGVPQARASSSRGAGQKVPSGLAESGLPTLERPRSVEVRRKGKAFAESQGLTVTGFWRRPTRQVGCPLVGKDVAETLRPQTAEESTWPSSVAHTDVEFIDLELQAAARRFAKLGAELQALASQQASQPNVSTAAAATEAIKFLLNEAFAKKYRSMLGTIMEFVETMMYMPTPAPGEGLLGEWAQGVSGLSLPEIEHGYLPPNASQFSRDALERHSGHLTFFQVQRWQCQRMNQLKAQAEYLAEVTRRSERFEGIRLQAQALILQMGSIRKTAKKTNFLRPSSEVPEDPDEKKDDDSDSSEDALPPPPQVDPAADRFAKSLAAGRAGKSSLVWLWGLWKVTHASLRRNSKKKGELVQQTLIGDLISPFSHWQWYWLDTKVVNRIVTCQAFESECHMLFNTITELVSKQEDLILELQVSESNGKRLTKQLDTKCKEREALNQKLIDARPELVKSLLCRVLDLILRKVLPDASLIRTMNRLHLATRELALLLLADEEHTSRLHSLSSEQLLGRWVSHHVMQFKLVASEVLEAYSKSNSEDASEGIEWSAREFEVYGDRCRLVRGLQRVQSMRDDLRDGAILAVVFGAVSLPFQVPLHPATLWPLDQRDQEARAQALCLAFRMVTPSKAAKYLLQPSDILQGNSQVLDAILAALFINTPRLPTATRNEVAQEELEFVNAASRAVERAIQQEIDRPSKKKKQVEASSEDASAIVEGAREEDEREATEAKAIKDSLLKWFDNAEKAVAHPEEKRESHLPESEETNVRRTSNNDRKFDLSQGPLIQQVMGKLESMAGRWDSDQLQDYSLLLVPNEAVSDLAQWKGQEILLRWVNYHLYGAPKGKKAKLPKISKFQGFMLYKLLSKIAPDVLAMCSDSEMTVGVDVDLDLETDYDPVVEKAQQTVILKCCKRCTGYDILTEQILKEEQSDMIVAMLSELMTCCPALPMSASCALQKDIDVIFSTVQQAARTETSGVQGLCLYLQEHNRSVQTAVEEVNKYQQLTAKINKNMRSFTTELLVRRAQGHPFTTEELDEAVRVEGKGVESVIPGERLEALLEREVKIQKEENEHMMAISKRRRAQVVQNDGDQQEEDEDIDDLQERVEELLRKHTALLRDLFRIYSRPQYPGSMPSSTPNSLKFSVQRSELPSMSRGNKASRSSVIANRSPIHDRKTADTSMVYMINLRGLTRLYRDCRLHMLKLSPSDVESAYNELKLEIAKSLDEEQNEKMDETALFESGFALEPFIEVMLMLACRAKVNGILSSALDARLSYVIDHHIIPFAGSPRDEFLHNLLKDPQLDKVLDKYAKMCRCVFSTYTKQGKDEEQERSRESQRYQATAMSVIEFKTFLEHAGAFDDICTRASIGRIFKGLHEFTSIDVVEKDSDSDLGSDSEDVSDSDQPAVVQIKSFQEEKEQDEETEAFDYWMSYQEFIDGLIIVTLFKEPSPFVTFVERFEKFIRTSLMEPLLRYSAQTAGRHNAKMFKTLADSFMRDMQPPDGMKLLISKSLHKCSTRVFKEDGDEPTSPTSP